MQKIIQRLFILLYVCVASCIFHISINSSHATIIKNSETSPDFQLSFQNPSYLTNKSNNNSHIFTCDIEKSECRVNMNYVKENGKNLSSTLECSTSIWSDVTSYNNTYTLDNQSDVIIDRCNPLTHTFSSGIHFIQISISDKKNTQNFSTKHFLIDNNGESVVAESWKDFIDQSYNPPIIIKNELTTISHEVIIENIVSDEAIVLSNTQDSEYTTESDNTTIFGNKDNNADKTNVSVDEISVPITMPFNFKLQRPSYINPVDNVDSSYICDESRDECRVNFTFIQEDGADITSQYTCTLHGSFTVPKSEQRCNPNTLIIPEGDHKLYVEITDTRLNIIVWKKIFNIQNIPPVEINEVMISNTLEKSISNDGTTESHATQSKDNTESITGRPLPKFNYIFQRPSYLINEIKGSDKYICDNTKELCKLNVQLLSSLDNTHISSHFGCKLTSNTISLGQEAEKCNPNTVIIPYGDNTLSFTVYEKKFPENAHTKSIVINNPLPLIIETDNIVINDTLIEHNTDFEQKKSEEENIENTFNKITANGSTNVETIEQFPILENNDFQILYSLQIPSYVERDNSKVDVFICNKGIEICRLNLVLYTEEGKNISSLKKCILTASFDISGEEDKCNPNTVVIPYGNHTLSIEMSDSKTGIIQHKEIQIINSFVININSNNSIIDQVVNRGTGIDNSQGIIPYGEINTPVENSIIKDNTLTSHDQTPIRSITNNNFDILYGLQSPSYIDKIIGENDSFICDKNKEICKVNIIFFNEEGKNISSTKRCTLTASFDLTEQNEKCNPNTVIIPYGNHSMFIEMLDTKTGIIKNKILTFTNVFTPDQIDNTYSLILKQDESSSTSNENITLSTISKGFPNTNITVQGKIGARKKVGYKNITCYTYSQCSINFTGGNATSTQREGFDFKWDFGNQIFSHKYNPSSIKYSPGEYRVQFYVIDLKGSLKIDTYTISVVQLLNKKEIKKVSSIVDSIQHLDKNLYNAINDASFKLPKNYFEKALSKEIKALNKNISSLDFTKLFGEKISTDKSKSGIVKKDETTNKNLQKNISLRISLQKKSLKVHGKTLPKSKIVISIGDNKYRGTSDNAGKYQFNITSFPIGSYPIIAEVFSGEDNTLIAKKASGDKKLTQEYLSQIESYFKSSSEYGKQKVSTISGIQQSTQNTLNKNISLRVSLQKKSLKVYGTTTPKSRIAISIGGNKYSGESDYQGKYQFNITSFPVGNHQIIAKVFSSANNTLIAQKSSNEKNLSYNYLQQVQSYTNNSSGTKDINNSLHKHISLRVAFQKKSLKIHGTTLPYSQVIIFLKDKKYSTQSGLQGKYTFKIDNFPVGTYKIHAQVFGNNSTLIGEKFSSEKNLSARYLNSIQSYKNNTSKKLGSSRKKQNITLRVNLQKKNLKLSGKTFAHSKIIFTIGANTYQTISDSTGKYMFKTNSIPQGNYKIYAQTYNAKGAIIAQKSSSLKKFSKAYIARMLSYKKNTAVDTGSNHLAPKIKKYTFEKISTYNNKEVLSTKNDFNVSLFLTNVGVTLLSIILFFVAIIRRELI